MKKILIVGLGVTGRALVNFFLKRGANVVAVDQNTKEVFEKCLVFPDNYPFPSFDFDLVVVSPGVLWTHPICQRAYQEGVRVIGETQLALEMLSQHKIIAVTGSNGKSTTVSLIAHSLSCFGYSAKALGNIGTPLISVVDEIGPEEIIVAELSSFQLEHMQVKAFDVALILNLSPNHLDRHETINRYFLAKKQIAFCLKPHGILGIEKKVAQEYGDLLQEFSYETIDNDLLAAVFFACKPFQLSLEDIVQAKKSFVSLPHRLEYVTTIKGVRCYNDSKATTIEAVMFAVKTIGREIILIAGGRHKGGSFSLWNESFSEKVKAIILIGEAKYLIASELNLKASIYFATTLQEAIEKGLQVALQGDTLILSPGCSSYDMFLNFEKRGEAFKKGLECESKRYHPDFSSC